ncbi:MAG: HEAT repeat domain-containing protein [Verrucomicrobiota bacterium]
MIETAEEFCRLRESLNPEEYNRAAHEEAPLQIWGEIIRARPDMRQWVAQNKTVPIKILEILAEEADSKTRLMVAGKRRITEEIALKLATDVDEGVRARLARNPNLPNSAIKLLRQDPSPLVRDALSPRIAQENGEQPS